MEVRPLLRGDEGAALELLRTRPVSNVIVTNFFAEHALGDVRASRGVFYGGFRGGVLASVALVGRYFMMHGDEEAARAFARVTRLGHGPELSVLVAPPALADAFEREFGAAEAGREAVAEPNLLLTLTRVATAEENAAEVRKARPEETEEVARIHALGSLAMQGVDPSQPDPEAYRERVRARIREGRVWVCADGRGITFKTDIAARSGRVAYLEGVLTRPDLVGMGVGTRAFSRLCRTLLRRYDTLCLFVSEENRRALDFYLRVGFSVHERLSVLRYAPDERPAAVAPACAEQSRRGRAA